jgi:hypothetical protein
MSIEVSAIRRQVQSRIEQARLASVARRSVVAEAERQYLVFLDQVAQPIFRTVASVLASEGYAFKVFTPAGGLRLASDRAAHSFVGLRLETAADPPGVVAEVSRQRGSQVLADDLPVGPGAPIDQITEDDVLAILLDAIGNMIDR